MIEVPEQDVARVRLDSRGRVTIPADLRDRWRLEDGDPVEVAVVGAEGRPYQCDECEERFDLPEVFVDEEAGRVVCGECAGVADRITS